ncbi:hypothetical protein GW750_03630 [bacterium]|nr:hypothetical protein [bacterium]
MAGSFAQYASAVGIVTVFVSHTFIQTTALSNQAIICPSPTPNGSPLV